MCQAAVVERHQVAPQERRAEPPGVERPVGPQGVDGLDVRQAPTPVPGGDLEEVLGRKGEELASELEGEGVREIAGGGARSGIKDRVDGVFGSARGGCSLTM